MCMVLVCDEQSKRQYVLNVFCKLSNIVLFSFTDGRCQLVLRLQCFYVTVVNEPAQYAEVRITSCIYVVCICSRRVHCSLALIVNLSNVVTVVLQIYRPMTQDVNCSNFISRQIIVWLAVISCYTANLRCWFRLVLLISEHKFCFYLVLHCRRLAVVDEKHREALRLCYVLKSDNCQGLYVPAEMAHVFGSRLFSFNLMWTVSWMEVVSIKVLLLFRMCWWLVLAFCTE